MRKFVMACGLAVLAIAMTIGFAVAAEGPGPAKGERGDRGGPPVMGQFNPVERVVRAVERITEKPLTDDQKKAIGEAVKVEMEAMKVAREALVKTVADITKVPVEKLNEALAPRGPMGTERGPGGLGGKSRGEGRPSNPFSPVPAPDSGRA